MAYEEDEWLEEVAAKQEAQTVDLSGGEDELFGEDFGEEGQYGEEE